MISWPGETEATAEKGGQGPGTTLTTLAVSPLTTMRMPLARKMMPHTWVSMERRMEQTTTPLIPDIPTCPQVVSEIPALAQLSKIVGFAKLRHAFKMKNFCSFVVYFWPNFNEDTRSPGQFMLIYQELARA